MMSRTDQRVFAASGALCAAAGVALSAYAAHTAADAARASLQSAALLALVHGVALAALAGQVRRRLGIASLALLLLGVLLFSGSLVAAHAFGTSTRLAPAGGVLIILGWCVHAIDALRR